MVGRGDTAAAAEGGGVVWRNVNIEYTRIGLINSYSFCDKEKMMKKLSYYFYYWRWILINLGSELVLMRKN